MRALLDVNVLVALLDGNHIHHGRARQWLTENVASGWASCALTQDGCIRVLSSQHYPNTLRPADVAARLTEATQAVFHQFWMASPSLLSEGLLKWEYLVGSRQVSDAYLLSLAVHHGGRLVTFGPTITPAVVRAATDAHLVVL
jgi:toxin-antitoxin system PIN domain toxin